MQAKRTWKELNNEPEGELWSDKRAIKGKHCEPTKVSTSKRRTGIKQKKQDPNHSDDGIVLIHFNWYNVI